MGRILGNQSTGGSIVGTLDDLSDVVITGATNGQVLKFNGTNWVNDTDSGGGATNLDGLTDVVISSPANNQFLRYNGTNWVNTTVAIVDTLDSLTDVAVSGATNGQVLTFNGTAWVPVTPTAAPYSLDSLTDVVASSYSSGNTLWVEGTGWTVKPTRFIDPTNSTYGMSTGGSAAANATALDAAIVAAISAGIPILIPAGKYKIGNLTQITSSILTEGSNLFIDGLGPVYLQFQYGSTQIPFDIDLSDGVVSMTPSSVSTVTSGGNLSTESEVTQVTLSGAPSNLLQGDMVSLVCNKLLPYFVNPYERNFQHEISEVLQVSGSNVFLAEKLLRDYASGYTYMRFYRWPNRDTNVEFGSNLIFCGDDSQDGNADVDVWDTSYTASQRPFALLRISGVRAPVIKSRFERCPAGGLRIGAHMGARIDGVRFDRITNLLSGQTVYGYAINFDGAGRFARLSNIDGYNARHITCTWLEEQQLTITAVTKAASAVASYTRPAGNSTHPGAGDLVYISGVAGMTELNGNWYTVSSVNTGAGTMTLNVNSTGFGTYTSGGTANIFQTDQWFRYGESTHRRIDNLDGRFNYGAIGDSHENEYGVYYSNIRVVSPVELSWSSVNPKALQLRGVGCTVDGLYLERGTNGISVQSFQYDHGLTDIKHLSNLKFKNQQDKASASALIDIDGNVSVTTVRKLILNNIGFEDCYHLISKAAGGGDLEANRISVSGDWGIASSAQYMFDSASGEFVIENSLIDMSAVTTTTEVRVAKVTGGRMIFRNVHFKGFKATANYPFELGGTASMIFENCTFEADSAATAATVRLFRNNNVAGTLELYGCKFINCAKWSSNGLINVAGTSSAAIIRIADDQTFDANINTLIGLSSSATTANYTYTQAYLRTGTVAPTVKANFLGEKFFDTVANKLYIAKAVGGGATDWYALN